MKKLAVDESALLKLLSRWREEAEKAGGLLSSPGDIDTLAANLLRVLGDPAQRTQFGEYGRSRIEEYLAPQRVASDFAALYARMLA